MPTADFSFYPGERNDSSLPSEEAVSHQIAGAMRIAAISTSLYLRERFEPRYGCALATKLAAAVTNTLYGSIPGNEAGRQFLEAHKQLVKEAVNSLNQVPEVCIIVSLFAHLNANFAGMTSSISEHAVEWLTALDDANLLLPIEKLRMPLSSDASYAEARSFEEWVIQESTRKSVPPRSGKQRPYTQAERRAIIEQARKYKLSPVGAAVQTATAPRCPPPLSTPKIEDEPGRTQGDSCLDESDPVRDARRYIASERKAGREPSVPTVLRVHRIPMALARRLLKEQRLSESNLSCRKDTDEG